MTVSAPLVTVAELIDRANALRAGRNAHIKRAMQDRDQAAAELNAAHITGKQAMARQQAAEARLAELLEKGERKVIGNSLITVNQDGGLLIEPVEVIGLL